jgi:formylglycine-generating enzyme required for sulfatase activity
MAGRWILKFPPVMAAALSVVVASACGPSGSAARPSVPAGLTSHTVSLSAGIDLEFVVLPAGRFTMGPIEGLGVGRVSTRQVEVASFQMARTELTRAQRHALMGGPRPSAEEAELPADGITQQDSDRLLDRLSELTGDEFDLPTEAQWEYACRAGGDGRWCFGDDVSLLPRYAWYSANSGGRYSDSRTLIGAQPHPVATRMPNEWGLFDMHGNVHERCSDHWELEYTASLAADAPRVVPGSRAYVARGGSYSSPSAETSSRSRGFVLEGRPPAAIGVRLVRIPKKRE